MINKTLVVDNGATTTFHRIQRFTSHPPFMMVTVQVYSYASEAAYLAGAPNAWASNEAIQMPIATLSGPLFETAEQWLVSSPDSPLFGGTIALDQMVTLENAKDRTWNRIKLIRDTKQSEPFEFDGHFYDSDKVNITGTALGAFIAVSQGQPFSVDFTLADNSVITLDGPQMVAVGIALLQHIDHMHQIGRTLRDQIYAEETDTFEKVAAIMWPIE